LWTAVVVLPLLFMFWWTLSGGSSTFDVQEFLAQSPGTQQTSGKVLVIVNPVAGGRGRADGILKRFRAVFQRLAPDQELCVLHTNSQGHAQRWVASQELTPDVHTIISIGGDGTMSEIVNGICSRKDSSEVLRNVALAIVPSGSGNGLAKCLGLDPTDIEKAATIAVRRRLRELNMFTVRQGQSIRFCFSFMALGFIADCDFESEAFRILGHLRFYVALIVRILFPRQYPIRFKAHTASGGDQGAGETFELSMPMLGVMASNIPYITSDFMSAPDARLDDGMLHIFWASGFMSRWETLQMLLRADSGGHLALPSVQTVSIRSLEIELLGGASPSRPFDNPDRMGKCDLDGELFPSNPKLFLSVHDQCIDICC